MELEKLHLITSLLRQEIVPATGCTEPAAVALATSYVASIGCLDKYPKSIKVYLSANMIKNAMGVGIPGTGMIGIPIAIALGWVIANPEKGLEVLDEFDQHILNKAKEIVSLGLIDIKLKEGDHIDKLYIEIISNDCQGNELKAIIAEKHTLLKTLLKNNQDVMPTYLDSEELMDHHPCQEDLQQGQEVENLSLTFTDVYNYAMQVDIEDVHFIYEAAIQNKKAANYALEHKMGHDLGRIIKGDIGRSLIGDSPLTSMLSLTSLACDARMDGAPITVVSNSGSGNQGISATLPVLSFAETKHTDYEHTVRALTLSSLTVIYVKRQLGRLSCLCGMIHSGLGTAAAVTYLLGGNKQTAAAAINNLIGNITGMICDGAKPSCSLKASTAISSAMISAMLAMEQSVVGKTEGIVDDDVDASIANLVRIGNEGMCNTDHTILDIMTHKKS